MGVILTIAAASIGIVSLARHLAFRPPAEDSPQVMWLARMDGE